MGTLSCGTRILREPAWSSPDPAPSDDLRVDASETPIEDLRVTYGLAHESYEAVLERYGDAYEGDDIDEATDE